MLALDIEFVNLMALASSTIKREDTSHDTSYDVPLLHIVIDNNVTHNMYTSV